MERVSGRLVVVWTEEVGTALMQDEAAGATVLHVDDCSPFNDDGSGGSLRVGDQVVAYTDVDDDNSTITLSEPLAVDAEQDDDVIAWDTLYDEADTRQLALVDTADRRDKADLFEAVIDDALEVVDGDRGRAGEACTLEREDEGAEWTVVRVGGRPSKARGRKWEDDDPYTLTQLDVDAGTFIHDLKHDRIVLRSMQVTWGRVQSPERYTVDEDAGTLTYTLAGVELAGDCFGCQYQYLKGPASEPAELSPLETLVLRGVSESFGGSSIPLPANTKVGDLIVMIGQGVESGAHRAKLAGGAVTDARLTSTYSHPSADDWWGTVTDLSDVAAVIPTNGHAIVATFGDTGGGTLTVAGQTSITKSTAAGNALETITVPASGERGVVLCATYDTGTSVDTAPFPAGFTAVAPQVGVLESGIRILLWTGEPLSPTPSWTESSDFQRYDRTITTLPVVTTEGA